MSKTLEVSRSASLIGLVGLALSAGSAALADDKTPQKGPATPLTGVTVVAPHRDAAAPAALPMIRDFVKAHGAPSQIGQLARWTQNICPVTACLPPAFNAFVTRRVREIAAEVGAPVKAGEQCQTNIEIIFTSEPQKFVDGLRDKVADAARRQVSRSGRLSGWPPSATPSRPGTRSSVLRSERIPAVW